MIWRKWSYTPAWIDYTVQIADKLEQFLTWTLPNFLQLSRRWELLDKYCICEKCMERKRKLS